MLVMVGFQLLVDQRFHLMRIIGAQRHHAQIVAQEFHRMVIGSEFREGLEEGAFFRALDMAFDRQHALGLCQLENGIEQAKQLQIIVLLVSRPLEGNAERLACLAQDVLRVGDDIGAARAAENQGEFEGLPEQAHLAAHGHIAAEAADQHANPA